MRFDVYNYSNINLTTDKIVIIDKLCNKKILELHGYTKTYELIDNEDILEVYNKNSYVDDITFIVQGRLDKHIYFKNICNLSKYGAIVESVWDRNLNLEDVNNYIRKNSISNGQNIYLQVYSVFSGLAKCNSKFVIKVRGDEYYFDWIPYIQKLRCNPDKVITTNIFFRTTRTYPFHISDHIIGSTKENMEKMFFTAKENLDGRIKLPNININIPEQVLTFSYLSCVTNNLDIKNASNIMKTYFDLVRLHDFKDFIVTFSMGRLGRKYIKCISEINKYNNVIDINSIDEV